MQPNPQKPKKPAFKFSIYWMYIIVLAFLGGMFFLDENTLTRTVDYSKFEEAVQSKGVSKIIVYTGKNQAEGVLTDSLASVMFRPEH